MKNDLMYNPTDCRILFNILKAIKLSSVFFFLFPMFLYALLSNSVNTCSFLSEYNRNNII